MSKSDQEKDHCDVCRQIREGCNADVITPEKCAVCSRKGYFVDPRTGALVICENCSRGFRMKLWLRHERLEGRTVPKFKLAS